MFKFTMRVAQKDPSGYYYVRWDLAQPVTVLAEDRKSAYSKCWALMGECPRRGWIWTAIIDSIEEVPHE